MQKQQHNNTICVRSVVGTARQSLSFTHYTRSVRCVNAAAHNKHRTQTRSIRRRRRSCSYSYPSLLLFLICFDCITIHRRRPSDRPKKPINVSACGDSYMGAYARERNVEQLLGTWGQMCDRGRVDEI